MSIKMQKVRARNAPAWRRWLEKHHGSSRGIWLEFFKKGAGKPSVTYSEALQEALCFGWIDSIVKRVDDERYIRKFTPRTNPRKWSITNLRHMHRLISAGRMTEAGLRVLGVSPDIDGTEIANDETPKRAVGAKQEPIPEFVKAAIALNPEAAKFWRSLASGYRRRYLSWILDAKGETTRLRRLSQAIDYLAAGTKSLLK